MEPPETALHPAEIPGWRTIRSDAGRYWASRRQPFPNGSEWDGPPYRTVDADTFDGLRAMVALQEEAALHVRSKDTHDG
ncbi:hypothetical protein [Streptosporangium carneum]|uniref:Uncharacterized protein n=1 Tax=Streptosporangium carneum TaxID=47481 RepID=A0A9W6MAA7_9ACTN|nr:hypothetical protein [Streptosporangium carneum]GLK06807.1 hypothetical protein GCM10017600_02120 [Streptosporangium carneum]